MVDQNSQQQRKNEKKMRTYKRSNKSGNSNINKACTRGHYHYSHETLISSTFQYQKKKKYMESGIDRKIDSESKRTRYRPFYNCHMER